MTDEDPGPLVRLFGLTGGRARPPGETFDLVAIVRTSRLPFEPAGLNPEHQTILSICRRPTPVADVAAQLGLPLNITRVLLGDLRSDGLVTIDPPQTADQTIDERTYREVLHGIRRL
ncbi:DUF742 domain-containing protein [Nonomuraea cavernae]|uniref:DUF742 domain-containing protein n=1 Tax=Nonomuraea cavernae TaxID=2045107 RepID=A0A918DSU4_9ACTN|nr:DUF742 domain-containing protein [Nonomuraea cavernae]MCA2190726.1 DUF742 domain-containing protein [Nonomuraea cavernae]GGO82031.1 hypothetical protein GCM10012289_72330 [Nonomuraea cavernae]